MPSHLGDFVDLVARLEQAARRLAPEIVKSQVRYAKLTLRPRVARTDRLLVIRENALVYFGLTLQDVPSFTEQREFEVVADFMTWVLHVPQNARTTLRVYVLPPQPTNLPDPLRRPDGKFDDVDHWNHRALVLLGEELDQTVELIARRPSVAAVRPCNELQLVE